MQARILCRAVVLACAIALLPAASAAADGIYLDLPNVPGESQAEGFAGFIELDSFQFGVGRSGGNTSGSTKTASAASFSEISLSKKLDSASPLLMHLTATGASIATAKIHFRSAGGDAPFTYLRYCLTNVTVTGFSQSSGGDRPSESISLSYGTIVQRYANAGADGQVGVFARGWDVTRNLSIANPACT
jgi:type VI secretion system secreted protein Hcp